MKTAFVTISIILLFSGYVDECRRIGSPYAAE